MEDVHYCENIQYCRLIPLLLWSLFNTVVGNQKHFMYYLRIACGYTVLDIIYSTDVITQWLSLHISDGIPHSIEHPSIYYRQPLRVLLISFTVLSIFYSTAQFFSKVLLTAWPIISLQKSKLGPSFLISAEKFKFIYIFTLFLIQMDEKLYYDQISTMDRLQRALNQAAGDSVRIVLSCSWLKEVKFMLRCKQVYLV